MSEAGVPVSPARRIARQAMRLMPPAFRFHAWGRWKTPQVHEFMTSRQLEDAAREMRELLRAGPGPSFCFLPTQTWFSSGFQRPHQLARALVEIGCPVAFCEPWSIPETFVTTGTHQARKFRGVQTIADRLHLLRCPWDDLADAIAGAEPTATVMLWPPLATFVREDSRQLVVYEMVDDHSLEPNAGDEWKRGHERWLRDADVVTATADDLIAQVRPFRDDALLLPNGVRTEDWTGVAGAALPADMAGPRRAPVVVGYYGALASWFDWDLLLGAARMRPDWSFVLIGFPYDKDVGKVHDRIASSPNVHYLGPKPYQELPAYLASFDVATIPFLLNPITHACSPVKLFEFMSGGKPVVATAMREILKYRSVLVAEQAPDFVARIEEAVARRDDPEYRRILREEAEANTWRARAEALRDAVTRAAKNGAPRREAKR